MDEIKLRARFRKISNSEECWQKISITRSHITTLDNMSGYLQVTDWEQYTGIKDKNGKEIYEGDILKCCDGSINLQPWMRENITVEYNNKGQHNAYTWETDSTHWFEKIGTIHENPELLK